MNESLQLSETAAKVAELAHALGVSKINELPGAWTHQIDKQWRLACNGHETPVDIPANDQCMGAVIQPYETAVWFNGWLAGLFTPFGGMFAAGEGANEDTFCAAMDAEIALALEDGLSSK